MKAISVPAKFLCIGNGHAGYTSLEVAAGSICRCP